MPFIIADPEWSDAAALSGTSSASFPLLNLQKMQPSDLWSAGTTSGFIQADLGSAQVINLVALLFTNASATATWRVRAASSAAALTGTPGYDSGTVPMWASAGIPKEHDKHAMLWIPATVTYRYVRIDFTDTGNTDGFVRAGRLYISRALEPSYNFVYGSKQGFEDPSERARLPGGQTVTTRRRQLPTFECTLRYLSPEEADTLTLIRLRQGASKDVLVCLDPNTTNTRRNQQIHYGLLESGRTISNWDLNLFEETVKLTGLI
jgi:hypothetical protein